MTEYHPIPQPGEITIREREDAMGAYFMMFAALAAGLPLPIINLIAAVIYFYLNKGKSRFVHYHSLQSLVSQVPLSILNVGMVFWIIWVLATDFEFNSYFKGYGYMVLISNILYIVFSIIAAVKARRGEFYYFIFFGKLSYHYAYRIKAEKDTAQNKPPKI